MRTTSTHSVLTSLAGIGVILSAAACSSSNATPAAGDAGKATGNDAGSSAGPDSGDDASSSSASCVPTAACPAADKTCIGLVDNSAQSTFGLRMSEIDFTLPAALGTGITAATIAGAVLPNIVPCDLNGTGSFSWLLQFDTTAGTLKTGGARPVSDPTKGYAFDTETLTEGTTSFPVAPVTFSGVTPDASGKFAVTTGQSLLLPIFLDAAGTTTVLLPLQQLVFTAATLSTSKSCIGTYNAAALSPTTSCLATATVPTFVDGAQFSGFVTLEQADTVIVSALHESLCVILSGNSGTYGTADSAGNTVCKRDASNAIVYQGDWCAATNAAATATCADSQAVAGKFAASSVLITN
jgi:hypothetical protein